MGIGLYGPGMHRFILDELELGSRVAMALDSENNTGWSAIDDLIYERETRMSAEENANPAPPEWMHSLGEGHLVEAEGLLEQGEIFRFSVKQEPDGTLARPVMLIAQAPLPVQMHLMAQLHDVVCDTLDAMQAQIARSN